MPSIGSAGDGDDNAAAESCFASLTVARVDRHGRPTRAAARVAIFAYLGVRYQRQRLHSTPGYRSPLQFETRAQAGLAA